MGKKAEKGKKGEAVQYYSRKQAMRHLQVALPNFTRLCLWKGIYPTQPNNLRAASKGDSKPKIYYKRKDINLLLHEPVVEKLRQIRAFNLKLKRAKERGDRDKVFRLQKSKPRYTLHHIVKELYPTRDDALRNLDDCLKSVFIFATLPKMTQFHSSYIGLCKRLKLQFLNYCIHQQALRKCFISIKGFYLEVEIKGIPVRWCMPHQHVATNLPSSCDYRLLANQMEFDCTMLAGLLKNLYTDAGLAYPPRFQLPEDGADWTESDILSSMSMPMMSSIEDQAAVLHESDQLNLLRHMDPDVAAIADKQASTDALRSLFRDKKVFLNREVPREIFCFMLRSVGASVSWDKAAASGASFDEDDQSINYHIIDRPIANGGGHVSRFYVQPQFVADSINAGRLLPVKDYLPGARLIPHLSPFADYTKGYVPDEYRYLRGEIDADELYEVDDDEDLNEEDYAQLDENDVDLDAMDYEENDNDEDEEEEEEEEEEIEDIKPSEPVKKSRSKQKRIPKEELLRQIEASKQIKLQEMSLPKKRLNLYKKMKHAEKKEKSTVENLKKKRQEINKKRKLAKK